MEGMVRPETRLMEGMVRPETRMGLKASPLWPNGLSPLPHPKTLALTWKQKYLH